MKEKSENTWDNEQVSVKITMEITEIADGGAAQLQDVLSQAEYCAAGLGFNIKDAEVGEGVA